VNKNSRPKEEENEVKVFGKNIREENRFITVMNKRKKIN
jgi:hypothetical protein